MNITLHDAIAWLLCLVGFTLLALGIGYNAGTEMMWEQAQKHGAAQHSQKTGAWEWTLPEVKP